jgi:alpha-ketoglutarate-dependent 2,4-dichlorophenoxyacetate dioxygenase
MIWIKAALGDKDWSNERTAGAAPMTPTIFPVTPDFVAEVGDVDLARLEEGAFAEIRRALWRFAVLIFPGQTLGGEEQLAFAGRFGPRDRGFVSPAGARFRLGDGLVDVSNITPEGEVWDAGSWMRIARIGDMHWHTDSSFSYVPALASILYGKEIPPVGGFTEFADERAAYDALPPETKRRLEGLVAEHNWFHSRKRYGLEEFPQALRDLNPPAPQLLVRTIPQTGRKTLYLASHIERITGMDQDEASVFVDELLAHATQPQFIYRHRWRAGDVVMWDNRCTMHRGTEYDDIRWRRDFQRATIADVGNSILQEMTVTP